VHGREKASSRPGYFTPGKNSRIYLMKGWETQKDGLVVLEKGIISELFACSISLTVVFAIDILKSSR
jgi:hypothetical protein